MEAPEEGKRGGKRGVDGGGHGWDDKAAEKQMQEVGEQEKETENEVEKMEEEKKEGAEELEEMGGNRRK